MPDAECPNLVLVILAVDDLERAKAFYREAFGWPVVVDVPVFVQMRTPGGMSVGLYQRESFAVNTNEMPSAVPPDAITSTELYVLVEDLHAALERIEAAGARRLSDPAPRSWGDLAAYVADPDGNVIALAIPGHEEDT